MMDEQGCGVDEAFLTASGEARFERTQKPLGQVNAMGGGKRIGHGDWNRSSLEQIPGGDTVTSFGDGVGAENMRARPARNSATAVDGGKLAVVDMRTSDGHAGDRVMRRMALAHLIEQQGPGHGMCDILGR